MMVASIVERMVATMALIRVVQSVVSKVEMWAGQKVVRSVVWKDGWMDA